MATKLKSPKDTSKAGSESRSRERTTQDAKRKVEKEPKRERGRPQELKRPKLQYVTVAEETAVARERLRQAGYKDEDLLIEDLPRDPTQAKQREDADREARERAIRNLAAVHPGVKEALMREEDTLRVLEPAERLVKSEAIVERIFKSDAQEWARQSNQPPPTSPSLSTNTLNNPDAHPAGARLTGGWSVDEPKLYRAFAVLMDLMTEVTEPITSRAKPVCVQRTTAGFIELMENFVVARTQEGSWVKARQMLPGFIDHFRNAQSEWPPCKDPRHMHKGIKRPKQPSVEQKAALAKQEADLIHLVKSFGYAPEVAEVKAFTKRWLVAGEHIKMKGGVRHVAPDASADLAGLGNPLSGSSISHREFQKTHIEKYAAEDPFRFYLTNDVPVVGAADVLGTLVLARCARAYYLRYLIEEEMRRTPTDADERSSEILASVLHKEAAERLGLPRAAYNPDRHTGSVAELNTWLKAPWDQRATVIRMGDQGKPFNFGLMRKDDPPADAVAPIESQLPVDTDRD